ncbi:MAG: fumarylacetoacetate hydrolase family protein [Balneolales bacterium]|nr:fumarylacetoacetate hydrolase family protein [Balneolales bacterium]
MRNIKIPGLTKAESVHTIYCIGRNYSEHAKELNNPTPVLPVVFTKPLSSLTFDGGEVIIPSALTQNVHHEVEMVVSIGKFGRFIPESEAMKYVSGYGIGIDVTARDVQNELKAQSYPWTLAKGMDTFAPLGTFTDAAKVSAPDKLQLSLYVNGEVRQSGNTSDMIFSIPALISFISQYCSLHKGDLIFTGTPAGVARMSHKDEVYARLSTENGKVISELKVNVREV